MRRTSTNRASWLSNHRKINKPALKFKKKMRLKRKITGFLSTQSMNK